MRWDRTSCFLRNTAETYVHPLLVYPPGNLKVCSKWGFPGAGADRLHPIVEDIDGGMWPAAEALCDLLKQREKKKEKPHTAGLDMTKIGT